MPKPLPLQEILTERLEYDPEMGNLMWLLPDPQSRVKYGARFGSKTSLSGTNSTKKYYAGTFCGVRYYAHRLIWMYMTGKDPEVQMIDHINGNGLDNRWVNLRCVDRSINVANQLGHKRRKTPYKHVYRRGNKWVGQVRRNKVLYSTARCGTAEEAKAAVDRLISTVGS